ncbi:hypothetical protein A2962_00935 [Candidatus Woesebacteria bacterium RIFCSPLOWO2_01_FULL_39_61]|uniref:Uncharacterized protein n=1 Tax=Candidatus Woesebacteria bacterium RIFCSPHIGHO2_02_FULL_39_13 TaxID=1802505 RepID=A0A1F7Z1M1_9BACT|nr:MAG: hypothetical protein A2692_00390 [Candidatus Woesebacteria bacterium RIFCSPHIGHO2_01_FULL_39_95]OGM33344.1 MAG: hypothetical protein A3D01_00440 [Candidatus Woesebacteria bacterium RIFCSPHIGHO2_02_FULL_39_13]OGM36277.1 MAG: hypothetical protein A3E13_03530 [Candidatus Woesebacteria bacterium RIFCSPHIGHO2_12_FULL_40_20]OGM68471.1 MAG: hypothetical protein A2962_00935 [Candidatus Woesebacteria bacterium RIFCSPLOWO2_01_FULL_39_61]OGM71304.1 MAG: hypothetical protein A3H19_02975 [Candidatus
MVNLNIALIGHGYWGKILFRNLQNTQSAQVTAICDKNQKLVSQLRLSNSQILVTCDLKEITSSKNIDAVVIATPAETHYKIAKSILWSGKHVLLEKPMALNKNHALELKKLADRKKLILMIDHTYLYAPEIRAAKQIVDSGDLGEIRFIETTRIGPGQYKVGCDVVWDFAPHDVSILYYFLGLPSKLSQVKSRIIDKKRADVSNLYFKFSNGCEAHVHLSWLSPLKIRKILIIGAKKTLFLEQVNNEEEMSMYLNDCYFKNSKKLLNYYKPIKNLQKLNNLPYVEPLRNVCHEFITSIINHTYPISDGQLGYEVVTIIEKIHNQ